jgi:hypothetical protein
MTTTTTGRSLAVDVAWMSRGSCTGRGDLPWTAEPEDTTVRQLLAMGGVCRACPVSADCAALAKQAKVTAGFWAGRHRDKATRVAGPGWATEPLPGFAGLGAA